MDPERSDTISAAIAFALEVGEINPPNGLVGKSAALGRAGAEKGGGAQSLVAHHLPGGAGIVVLAAHAGDVAAGEVLPGEALEEGGARGAGDEHEDVVGGGVHVGGAPGLEREAVASGSEDEVVARGHVGLVEREGLVGVVYLEDPVGA